MPRAIETIEKGLEMEKKRLRKETHPSVCIGIDPGQNGGIAWIHRTLHVPQAMAEPMPETERDVWDCLNIGSMETKAVIEKVHSMPKQGVASTFKFGVGYGGLRMALIGRGIPFREVTPQQWMKALEIPPRRKSDTKTTWKKRLLSIAQQWFPEVMVTLKTADALLLAEYCRRFYN
jgi:crossover junction endodeoxyribonuclease RuvC